MDCIFDSKNLNYPAPKLHKKILNIQLDLQVFDHDLYLVLDIDHDQILEDLIEYSKFSYAVWEQDSSGFYYQKYNPTSVALSDLNKSPKLYFHKLGTKQNQDRLIYQDTLNPDLSWSINIPQEGAYRILSIGEGTDERNFLSISFDDSLNFIPLISEFVATYNFLGGTKDRAWFFSNLDAPNGRIFLLDLSSNEPIWRDLIPESKFPISSASVVGDKLILNYLVDTLSEVKIFDLEGNFITELPFAKGNSVIKLPSKSKIFTSESVSTR